ncbi:MAG: hypothetical protein WB699_18095 [Bacteroidota bacterium]
MTGRPNLQRAVILTAFLLVIVALRLHAQTYVYFAQPSGVSVRGDAFAGAYCADAFDVTAMYSNPASLSFLRTRSVVVSDLSDWTLKSQTVSAAAPLLIDQDLRFGIGASYSGGGTVFAETGEGVPVQSYEFDVASSTRLIPTLSAGVLIGIRSFKFANLSRSSEWAQLGVYYNPLPGIAYGLVYRYRRGLVFAKAGQDLSLSLYPNTPADLELGAAMMYPANSNSPIVSLSLTTVRAFPSAERFNIKGGLEVYPISFLALRLGYKVGSTINLPRYGIGVHVMNFRCDFGIGPSQADDRFHGFSLSYSF